VIREHGGVVVLAMPLAVAAQPPPDRVPRVGVLMYTEITEAFREAFRARASGTTGTSRGRAS
jgi:hypothetical protein